MKIFKALIVLFFISFLATSCFEDNDDNQISSSQINDFVWKGMNAFYLYKDNIQKLSDDEFGINTIENRYGTNDVYNNYLNSFFSPEDLFESLIYQPETVDRFSWIVDDYIALEQQFEGTTGTAGIEFSLFASPNSDTEGFGVIRLVLPNSPADNTNLKRGDIFYAIDGQRLTNNNLGTLLNQETYTLNLGFFNDKGTVETTDDSIDPIDEDITLSKVQYTENPVFKTNVINVGGENVGYVMYNGFTDGSENELNTVFGELKSNNIQHLVLDLRYNPGGSVSTTAFLASMITGQFTGDIFEKLIFNSNFQSENTNYLFQNKLQNGNPINSLNLDKIYVLTTSRSASASEGLINGLYPYIEVIQIGTNTTGKTQASRTLYDSPNFQREGVNPSHTYAMQPLIATGVNKNNEEVPGTGLTPSLGFEYQEYPLNYGVLGDVNEPLLALALADIENSIGKFSAIKSKPKKSFKLLKDSNDFNPLEGGMLIE
ncbi:C-terminal processing protease CtpA/Prc, contains a PDZ domain [Flaviramulus basaltis]|uniref:C-terminal processing protease CtpA/Prc, contains a PDZ domain n=1 Tax=Flaviramulus basaltis TaxID=369401 RepID=A0A1K2IJ83_9FLAO|nr:S41 family peptidase [Flaviramulus basaltis]SFZ92484.1 C-terminal processing protease CtpA/Prc, contains a PDZ domain [Flaviramulus basaltis]